MSLLVSGREESGAGMMLKKNPSDIVAVEVLKMKRELLAQCKAALMRRAVAYVRCLRSDQNSIKKYAQIFVKQLSVS